MDELNWKLEQNSWSVLECIVYLNLYSNFYLLEIKYRINKNIRLVDFIFNLGFVGNYFVNFIWLNDKLKKMKILKEMNFIGSILSKDILC